MTAKSLFATAVAIALCQSARAEMYMGTASGPNPSAGFVGQGSNWGSANMSLSWTISGTSGGLWTYSYTWNGNGAQNLSHLILELTPGVTLANLTFTALPKGAKTEVGTFSPDKAGKSNPGLPGSIYGLKIDVSNLNTFTFTFTTMNEPVWGDFYAKDGGDNAIWNSGFLDVDPNNPAAGGMLFGHILRPNGGPEGNPAPAPPAVVLLASGGFCAFGGFVFRRRRK